ncbi:hypothetical protein EUBSIR_01330 [[Eubacterium] siraeum DSM 15702]|uniref:Uncharacterized protein n=1 Tax=[Eubacterium] siraeum DSM 15702 TaxID=428128 RepID=B0MNC0_9FIRM|nr:hypothetical protein EUBSIR_01330 [[Eubacterium] siraeum DSM 15702]
MKGLYLFTVYIVLCCFSSFFGTDVFSFLTSRIILYRYGKRKIRCLLNSSGKRFR